MTVRTALVQIAGAIQEMPTGDSLAGAGSASGGTPVFVPSGSTFTVPRYSQVLSATRIACDGFLQLDGILIEVM